MSKILLLGGTGAMGVYLRDILVAKGDEVVVTSRSSQSPCSHIEFVRGDARDNIFLCDLIDRVKPDAIVDFMVYGTAEFRARLNLLLSKTRHYVFLSSYRVFSDAQVIVERSPRLLDVSEDVDYLKTDEYALRKARCEDLLRRSIFSNWTIVRPGITYSTKRFQLGCLEADTLCYRSFLGLPVVMPREMRTRQTTMTWGRDVARMISLLVLNPNAYREDFNCSTAEHHSWDEVCGFYTDLIGADVRDCTVENYIMIVGRSAHAQVRYDRMFDRVLNNSKVLQATGLKQSEMMPLKDGLSLELVRYRKVFSDSRPNVPVNARMDRFLGTTIPLGGFSFRQRREYYASRYPVVGLAMRGLGVLRRALSR